MGSCFGINSQPKRKRPKTSLQAQITAGAALPHLAHHLLARRNKAQRGKPPKLRPSPRAAFTCPSSESSSFCHQLSDNVTWDLPKSFSWSSSRGAAAASCVLCCGSRETGSPEALGAGVGSVFPSLVSGEFSFVQPEQRLKVQSLEERRRSLSLHYSSPRSLAARCDLGTVFWSFPLATHKGEKSCSDGSGNEALMPVTRSLGSFCSP